jgi:outer membrane protein
MLSTPLNSTDSFIEKAYENQPQIKAAETRILSAQKQIEITKTQFLPSVSATAGLGTSYYNPFSSNNNGFFKQYKDNFGQNLVV